MTGGWQEGQKESRPPSPSYLSVRKPLCAIVVNRFAYIIFFLFCITNECSCIFWLCGWFLKCEDGIGCHLKDVPEVTITFLLGLCSKWVQHKYYYFFPPMQIDRTQNLRDHVTHFCLWICHSIILVQNRRQVTATRIIIKTIELIRIVRVSGGREKRARNTA